MDLVIQNRRAPVQWIRRTRVPRSVISRQPGPVSRRLQRKALCHSRKSAGITRRKHHEHPRIYL